MRQVPAALRKYAKIASQWGISDDALRQYQCSKHPIDDVLAVYDAIEESRPVFEQYWDKLGAKINEGRSLTITERCYFYLVKLRAEIAAEIAGSGRTPTKKLESLRATRLPSRTAPRCQTGLLKGTMLERAAHRLILTW